MGEDEIKAIIEGVLSELGIENPTGKDKGNIMKHLMPKVKGKADGKLVNDLGIHIFQIILPYRKFHLLYDRKDLPTGRSFLLYGNFFMSFRLTAI